MQKPNLEEIKARCQELQDAESGSDKEVRLVAKLVFANIPALIEYVLELEAKIEWFEKREDYGCLGNCK